MEKKLIVAAILLIAGLLGVGHLITGLSQENNFNLLIDDDIYSQFQEFQWNHNKVYNGQDEENYRFKLFNETYHKIKKFNEEHEESKVAINKFADLTDEEYENTYLTKIYEKEIPETTQYNKRTNRPQVVDWVGTYVWTGVNNQGECGSCWAFSSTQALEAAYAKEYGTIKLLSVQEVLDCAENEYGDIGCKGGLYDHVFKWVKEHGGICARDEYPRQYLAKPEKCEENQCPSTLKNINGWVDVTPKNKEAFLDALAIVPLSIAIDAKQFAFKFYSHGIIKDPFFWKLDHAVLAVGYNEQEGYIKVKNSWGERWGEKGYFRIAIKESGHGTLGSYLVPAYPTYPGEK